MVRKAKEAITYVTVVRLQVEVSRNSHIHVRQAYTFASQIFDFVKKKNLQCHKLLTILCVPVIPFDTLDSFFLQQLASTTRIIW